MQQILKIPPDQLQHSKFIFLVCYQFIAIDNLPLCYNFCLQEVCTQQQSMGACTISKNDNFKEKNIAYDLIPYDTESLNNVLLPKLTFYVLLSDIKIKKCPHDYISLKFKIGDIHQYETTMQQIDAVHQRTNWRINDIFDFEMTEYQFRKQFLIIEAFDKNKKLLGTLKVNLFVIWTGPYHLDFEFKIEKAKFCRISFNFKISQSIHLKIQNVQTQLYPSQPKFIEDKLNFSMQTILGQHRYLSNNSYTICVKQNPSASVQQQKDLIQIYQVKKQKLIWKDQTAKKLPLPKFDKIIPYYQIYGSSLHLIFWKIIQNGEEENQLRYEIESQCFIALTKLINLQYCIKKDPTTSISYMERQLQLEEKTWLHGKEVGKAKINIKFVMQTHHKQMQACVRTEEGILTSSPVFSQNNDKVEVCEQIQSLTKVSNQVHKQFINLDQNTQKKNNFIIIQQNIFRINNLLLKELNLLKKSSKQSILFYQYKSQKQLIKAQRYFIDLAFRVITVIHQGKADLQQNCYSILTTILKRGQFKLSHLGFNKIDKQNIAKGNIKDLLRSKIDVCLKYQQFLNQLLKETLTSLEFKGDQKQRVFAQSFCSYAYFRIPLFRQHIISVIKRDKDPQIPEWRGTQFNLYKNDIQNSEGSNADDDFYSNLFDWQNNFQKCLVNEQKYKQNKVSLEAILREDKWKNRLAKRSGAFYTFLQNLVKQIEYVSVVSKYIKWQYLPGYSRLLHAFLVQMKNNKIRNYTDRFKTCCIKLLANQKLLNIFVVILLKKTSINQAETIFYTFQLIDGFFTCIKNNQRPIPTTFDYKFFVEGIKHVLESDLQYSISQVLLFIFNHFHTFSQDFCLQLSLYLLSKPFFKFFFSWSYNLRHIFHNLLFIRINKIDEIKLVHGSSPYLTNLKFTIKERSTALMRMIQCEIEPNAIQANKDRFYQKNLYKKMKYKLLEKKKGIKPQKNLPLVQKRVFYSQTNIKSMNYIDNKDPLLGPLKMIFFKDQQMKLCQIKPTEMSYVKQGLIQYNAMTDDLKKKLTSNPNYVPDIKVKKVIDQKQLGPITVDEW